ncbi:MAG TPA: hypothetical protein VJC13_01430 [Candidatus Paceibacterota bacterium]|nr:4-O-beta-D-mannosyl-D-glucose phosphorylase [uncultured archaeon]
MKKITSKPQKIKKTLGTPLSVVSVNDKVFMLERLDGKITSSLFISESKNGLDFVPSNNKVSLRTHAKKKENIKKCKNFSISTTPTCFIMTYIREGKTKKDNHLVVAKSLNLYEWYIKSEIPAGDSVGAVVFYDKSLQAFVLYQDGLFIKSQLTKTLVLWRERRSLLFTGRAGMFDREKTSIIGGIETKEGLLIIYDSSVKDRSRNLLQVGGVLFDVKDPRRIVWRSEAPLWQGVVKSEDEKEIVPVGFVYLKNVFVVYWLVGGKDLLVSTFPALFSGKEIYQYEILEKFDKNPVIIPRSGLDWEAIGTFNPSVFQDGNKLHLFYRALGNDGISRVGYASSKDGLSFERRPFPVFEPSEGSGMPKTSETREPIGYHPTYYTSGGGWGGSEDPRVVKIDNTIYMTYVAFEGWNSVRMALTSISIDDFKAGRWKWKEPIMLSRVNEIHKNWVLFPEKINNKFAILHGLSPEVLVDYVDNFDNFDETKQIKSRPPVGGRETHWDSRMRGAGPPPIKTDLGWLLLYHAQDRREPHKYKLGAMILDKKDPTKILHRSAHPILYPEMDYENDGKPGVVYASGAVIRNDDLRIYYGGGDKVVCIASAPLREFMNYLVTEDPKSFALKKIY